LPAWIERIKKEVIRKPGSLAVRTVKAHIDTLTMMAFIQALCSLTILGNTIYLMVLVFSGVGRKCDYQCIYKIAQNSHFSAIAVIGAAPLAIVDVMAGLTSKRRLYFERKASKAQDAALISDKTNWTTAVNNPGLNLTTTKSNESWITNEHNPTAVATLQAMAAA
jgi:hypothetical protein